MTDEIVPSYLTKLRSAKEDLDRLRVEIDTFNARKPYAVIERAEGKRKPKVRRLAVTASPANTEIPRVAGDIFYSLRSDLDHLMTAIVPNEQTALKAMFPVYFKGVWDAESPLDNEQRVKERSRWRSDTVGLSDEVLTILKWA